MPPPSKASKDTDRPDAPLPAAASPALAPPHQPAKPARGLGDPFQRLPRVQLHYPGVPALGRRLAAPASPHRQGQDPAVVGLDPEPAGDAPSRQRAVAGIEVDVAVEATLSGG